MPLRSAIRAIPVVLLLAGCQLGAAQRPSAASATVDSAALVRAAQDSTSSSSSETKPLHRERKVTRQLAELEPVVEWQWSAIFATALAMVGAIVLTLPVALAYRTTKPLEEFDPGVMHTSLILAPTIAAILIVIQGSLAMAFSLAGVATAVRFRSSIKDTNDAVYVFVAVAIGLAAGGQALDIGVAISAIFSALMLLLWKSPFRNTGNPQREAHRNHRHHHDSAPLIPRESVPADGHLPPLPAHRAKRTRGSSHSVGSVSIRASDPGRARPIIEAFLDRATKRWRLESATRDGDKDLSLLYAVRCRKRVPRDELLEELRRLALAGGFSVEGSWWGPVDSAAAGDGQLASGAVPASGRGLR